MDAITDLQIGWSRTPQHCTQTSRCPWTAENRTKGKIQSCLRCRQEAIVKVTSAIKQGRPPSKAGRQSKVGFQARPAVKAEVLFRTPSCWGILRWQLAQKFRNFQYK
jgi:hypothetical protein